MKIKRIFEYVIVNFLSMIRLKRVKPVLNQTPRDPNSPPDLDQLLADLKARLFGKSSSGAASKTPTPKELGVGFFSVFIVVFLLWCVSGFFIVQEGFSAVLTQFGKYHSTVGAGFHWRIPYPFQAHESVNISQIRKVEVGFRGESKNKQPNEALMLTDDENIVDLQFVVQFRLKEDGAKDFLFNNRPLEGNDFGSDVLVRQIAEAAVREVVGKKTMDFVLYEGREQVAGETQRLTQQILDRYQSGVFIMNVSIQNAQPPEQVQSAFDNAVRAGQDRERQINEGQAYANDVIPKARGTAARLIEEANAYKVKVVEMASGDAERFKKVLSEYSKAPQVTRQRMYLETMQTIFTNTSKIFLDNKSSGGQLLYLPLDRLLESVKKGDDSTPMLESKPDSNSSLNEVRPKDLPSSSSFSRDRVRNH